MTRAESAAEHFNVSHIVEVPDERVFAPFGIRWVHIRAAHTAINGPKKTAT